ncbi:MAG: hypothetical protein ATN35_05620 [Epulopiscium sp. Nele67-Bin004]|nr:MAG: hypothetical protein ATN35_05620 [Epulopiscium sp. Nele67-Bin004]
MKKFRNLVLTGVILGVPLLTAELTQANTINLNLIINGEVISSVSPVQSNGTTLVPVRVVSEQLGANIEWDSSTQKIVVEKGNVSVEMQIGSATGKINGQATSLTTEPVVINGTTMIPLRFVSEAFDVPVEWDSVTSTVLINSSIEDLAKVSTNVVEYNAESKFDGVYNNNVAFNTVTPSKISVTSGVYGDLNGLTDGNSQSGIGMSNGDSIQYDFATTTAITGIEIWGGASSEDWHFEYTENDRPKKLLLEFSNNTSIIVNLKDITDQGVIFDEVYTDYVKVTLLEYYAGAAKASDTNIREMKILANYVSINNPTIREYTAEHWYSVMTDRAFGIEPSSIVASSQLADEGNHNYSPYKTQDWDDSTAWVEGVSGDGVGEWILFNLQPNTEIRAFIMTNGLTTNENLYLANNRIKKARLDFSDGSSCILNFADNELDPQGINWENPVVTDYVKVTILETYAGTKYNDTCISKVDIMNYNLIY